jgi:hypothetical protein
MIMSKTIDYTKAQKKLIVLWCLVSAIVFIIYFVQTLTGKYLDNISEVWEWVLQFVIPPLTLMIGVLINQLSLRSHLACSSLKQNRKPSMGMLYGYQLQSKIQRLALLCFARCSAKNLEASDVNIVRWQLADHFLPPSSG